MSDAAAPIEIAHDRGAIPEVSRALDLDSHEMVPVGLRDGVFGETALNKVLQEVARRMEANHPNRTQRDLDRDDTPVNYDNVWKLKGGSAPSAIDLERRPEVMDLMGIERQLCFPTFGITGLIAAQDPYAYRFFRMDEDAIDWRGAGLEVIEAHNRWAVGVTKTTSGRVRPVGMLLTETVEQMVRDAEKLIADGIRALVIPVNAPPAGTSPADPALDPFWRMCERANVPVTIHLGTERGFVASQDWSKGVEVFQPSFKSTIEFVIEPLSCVTLHYAPENFLAAMVLGGVFERHPGLRLGIIELGATWVGPLADRMDMWAEKMFVPRFSQTLSMPPSAYLARNVRVTPFFFEPVAQYFERYPHLSDVFCFSTDYPHFEGGNESKSQFADALRSHSDDIRDGFFYRNPAWILPS